MIQYVALEIKQPLEPKIVKNHPNKFITKNQNISWSEKLKTDLLRNYDRYLRPDEDVAATLVNLSMVLKNIDLSYVTSKLDINSWISMKWYDPALQWDPSKYGDIKHIYLAPTEVWQPDLSTFNSAGGNDVSPFGDTFHIAYNDGKVLWVPPCKFQVYCDLDLTYWPFDTQTCELILGSWVYDGNAIDFHFEDDSAVEISQDNSLWEVSNVSQKRDVVYFTCCPEPYVILTYTMTFRLRAPAYGSLVFVPTFVIIILTLGSFYLPPSSSEKFLLCGTNIIMTSALLIFFSQKLPLMVSTTPLIVMFYTNTLCLLSVSMIVSIVLHGMFRRHSDRVMPRLVRNILNSKMLNAVDLDLDDPKPSRSAFTIEGDTQEYGEQSLRTKMIPRNDCSEDWKKLVCVIDRTLFYMYICGFLLMGARCFI